MDCLICGEGKLNTDIDLNVVDYLGIYCILPLHFSVCDYCGTEQASSDETTKNKKYMIDFKNRVHEGMEI